MSRSLRYSELKKKIDEFILSDGRPDEVVEALVESMDDAAERIDRAARNSPHSRLLYEDRALAKSWRQMAKRLEKVVVELARWY